MYARPCPSLQKGQSPIAAATHPGGLFELLRTCEPLGSLGFRVIADFIHDAEESDVYIPFRLPISFHGFTHVDSVTLTKRDPSFEYSLDVQPFSIEEGEGFEFISHRVELSHQGEVSLEGIQRARLRAQEISELVVQRS